MILSSGSLGYAAYLLNVSRDAIGNIFSAGPAMEPSEGRYNFLMMGGDAGSDRTGRRPDSLSVISVDAKTGETAIISVPRNLQNAQFSEDSPDAQRSTPTATTAAMNASSTPSTPRSPTSTRTSTPAWKTPARRPRWKPCPGRWASRSRPTSSWTWTASPGSSMPWAASGSRPAAGSRSAARPLTRPTESTACRWAGSRPATIRWTATTPSGTAAPANSWTTTPASHASSASSRPC